MHQSWNGTAASKASIEVAVRSAEQLVSKAHTRYVSTARTAISAEQVRTALASGGILGAKVDEYINAWTIQLFGGGGLGGRYGSGGGFLGGPSLAQMRSELGAAKFFNLPRGGGATEATRAVYQDWKSGKLTAEDWNQRTSGGGFAPPPLTTPPPPSPTPEFGISGESISGETVSAVTTLPIVENPPPFG